MPCWSCHHVGCPLTLACCRLGVGPQLCIHHPLGIGVYSANPRSRRLRRGACLTNKSPGACPPPAHLLAMAAIPCQACFQSVPCAAAPSAAVGGDVRGACPSGAAGSAARHDHSDDMGQGWPGSPAQGYAPGTTRRRAAHRCRGCAVFFLGPGSDLDGCVEMEGGGDAAMACIAAASTVGHEAEGLRGRCAAER